MAGAENQSYDRLLARHLEAHQRLFRRVRLDLPADRRLVAAHRRAAAGARSAKRPAIGGAAVPVRPLPADRQQPARLPSPPTCKASGTRTWIPPGTLGVHDQYQPGDELLAGRSRRLAECVEPLVEMVEDLPRPGAEWPKAITGWPAGCFIRTPISGGRAPPMDGLDLGHLFGGRGMARHPSLGTLSLQRRQGLPPPASIPCSKAPPSLLDTPVEYPGHAWLVTCPSTSPENFPARPGNGLFTTR